MRLTTAADRSNAPIQNVYASAGGLPPAPDWREMKSSDHFVHFYETDDSLVDTVARFIAAGFEAGENCIIITTAAHREGIETSLQAQGFDVLRMQEHGQYVALDAATTLAGFMCEGSPDPDSFQETVGGVMGRSAAGGKRVRAFGEMVSLLWSAGNQAGAIRLEELWNELARIHAFCLFCTYSMECFSAAAHAAPFAHICTQHSHVIPAESYTALSDPGDRLREVSLLQQKARMLEAEISRRKKVESELADFLETASEGIHTVGPDGTILWANAAELNLLGYRSDEYVGHSIIEFHADRRVIEDMLAKLLRGEILYNYPAKLRCKSGAIKHVLVHSNAYFEAGNFLYTRCFSRDVTHIREAEIVLQRLAAIVDSSDDAIIGKTLQGIITSWNKGAERIFGYSAEEAIGRSKTILFPPDRVQEEDEILARLRRGESLEHFESVRVHRDGRTIDVSLTISPIKGSDGVIVGASTIARDITRSKQQQRELALLNASLKRSVKETHHRVKNNLQIIGAMIEMQTWEHKGEKTVPIEVFDRLQMHVCTLGVVHELLTNGLKETEDAQRLSTKLVLDKLLPMLQRTAWNHTVCFEIADAEIPSKQCISLALIVNELVSNALKHGASTAEVNFTVKDGQAALEVCDDGAGFPEDFDPETSANTGLQLVESLLHTDLEGQAEYQNRPQGGAEVRATFALVRPDL